MDPQVLNRQTFKVSVDGRMRRVDGDYMAFRTTKKLLDLVQVNSDELVSFFYYDDEDDKIFVLDDKDLVLAHGAQCNIKRGGAKNVYFKVFLETKKKREHKGAGRRGQKKLCFGTTERCKDTNNLNEAWEKIVTMLERFTPLLPREVAKVIQGPEFRQKMDKLKDSTEVKTLLKILAGDLGKCSNPILLFMKVKSSKEFKDVLDQLQRQFPELKEFVEEFEQNGTSVHYGVTCDGCNAHPIRGLRFKCVDCADFDFCSTCRFSKDHDTSHMFETVDGYGSFFPAFPMAQLFTAPLGRQGNYSQPNAAQGSSGGATTTVPKVGTKESTSVNSVCSTTTAEASNSSSPNSERSTDDEFEVVPDAAGPKDESNDYQSELKILEEMGFTNTQLNRALLKAMGGNLRNVVQALFSTSQ